jgi:hypothetical protein
VTSEHIELVKRALIKQILHALTGKHLASVMLPGDRPL